MIDFEAEYNARARVPETSAILAQWAVDAAAFRAVHPPATIAYGVSPRETCDIFAPAQAGQGAPLMLLIHGGYWQAMDPSSSSHMAAGALAHGFMVAVAGYDLCPTVPLATIVAQMRACCRHLWNTQRRKIVVYGHSAGGHLAAMLLATDWRALDADLPADLVLAGLAISGLFDLEPLLTTSINVKVGLDAPTAAALSPVRLEPRVGARLDAVVGSDESDEFHRQSRLICDVWGSKGVKTAYAAIPATNHFTVVAGLADPHSALTRRLVALARG